MSDTPDEIQSSEDAWFAAQIDQQPTPQVGSFDSWLAAQAAPSSGFGRLTHLPAPKEILG